MTPNPSMAAANTAATATVTAELSSASSVAASSASTASTASFPSASRYPTGSRGGASGAPGAPPSGPPVNRYTRVAVLLHWLVALLIIGNIVLIWMVDFVPDERVRLVIDTHKSTGITVLGLAILRLLWRFAHKPPALPGSYARWERRASSIAHGLLYSLIFLLPLSGWLHDSAWKNAAAFPLKLYGLVPWPRISYIMELPPETRLFLHGAFGAVHEYAGYALYALLALHIAGALKHQWIDRQKQLQRMWL